MKIQSYIQLFLLFVALTLAQSISAQYENDSFIDKLQFRSIGPASKGGRITAIDVDPFDKNHILVGSAGGGIFCSKDRGMTWDPIFDKYGSASIGALKFHPTVRNEIWVGTGEGNPRNSQNLGNGVYKSTDGGLSWVNMGLEKTKSIHRIIIHTEKPNEVLIGAQGNSWSPNIERGVFKTTNGGNTWTKVLYNSPTTGIADMVVDPSNPNKIFAAMWEFQRKPWIFNSGGKNSGLYYSLNGGDSWSLIDSTHGMPKGDLGRIGLAVSRSNPQVVYALVEAKENGLYRSNDGGIHWQLINTTTIGDRPFYYAEIYVAPEDENTVYNLYTLLSKSSDGGKTFNELYGKKEGIHVDNHALWIDPNDPKFIILGNDGGLYISHNSGQTWSFKDNLPIGQFYHINVDSENPYNVYGGLQDNGTLTGPSRSYFRDGLPNHLWQFTGGGDGFDSAPHPTKNYLVYGMSQGGNLFQFDKHLGSMSFIRPMHPISNDSLRFNWNSAFSLDPFTEDGLYYGSQFVHYSNDMGQSWEIISPDLTSNDTSKQKSHLSGGLTPDVTSAENHTTLLCITPHPLDQNMIITGSDDGQINISKDHGKSWQNITSRIKGLPIGAWIQQVKVSKFNKSEIWIVANNYRQGDWGKYLFYSKDGGMSWKNMAQSESIHSFACSFIQDDKLPNLWFLGTENGLFFSHNAGSSWSRFSSFPHVQVMDMAIQENYNEIAIATFGRSLYIFKDLDLLRDWSKNYVVGKNYAYTAPTAIIAQYGAGKTTVYSSHDSYYGDNSWDNGKIIIQKPYIKNDTSINIEYKVLIINEIGDTVQTIKTKLNQGQNRLNWNLKGNENATDMDLDWWDGKVTASFYVPAGKYHVIFDSRLQLPNAEIIVDYDQRIKEIDHKSLEKRFHYQRIYTQLADSLTKITKSISLNQDYVASVRKLATLQVDSVKIKANNYLDTIEKHIKTIDIKINGQKKLKGINRQDEKATTILVKSYFLLDQYYQPFSPNSELRLNQDFNHIHSVINDFKIVELQLIKYKEMIKSLNLFDHFKK